MDNQPDSKDATPVGILLANVGTPNAPTARAVRPYLREFLSDPRIVDYPRWLWLPLLYGVILTFRPRRSARLYQNIWTEAGSPLLVMMREQASALQEMLNTPGQRTPVLVEVGLRYGNPSIESALKSLQAQGARRVLIFPLFPQYSATTTATTYDAVFQAYQRQPWMPEMRTIHDYHNHPGYIRALASSIRESFATHGQPDKLLFSFHGIPQRYARNGDPYPNICQATACLVASELGLSPEQWFLSYQSRFGPEPWLKPYTDETLEEWGREHVRHVQVIAPGFSADCLETNDELGREARHSFIEAGGEIFHYIPALNTRPDHLAVLAELACQSLQGWL